MPFMSWLSDSVTIRVGLSLVTALTRQIQYECGPFRFEFGPMVDSRSDNGHSGALMRVYLTGLGCRLNEAELETWARTLRGQGHKTLPTVDGAEMIVVNTCAVTQEASRKSRKLLRGLHRKNPTAPVVVTGCYSELHADEAAAIAGVDLVVSNTDKERLVQIAENKLLLQAMPQMASSPESSHMYPDTGRTRAFVKVQDGCRNRCTFCIVTIARGSERSRGVSEIIEEVNELHLSGFQEAVLTGVHLGGYGSDLDTDLFGLVNQILSQTTIPRIRLSSLEPWDLPEHFWALWQNPRLMPHLHLPLQSGSDTVLKRMARRCSTETFRELVQAAREQIPALSVTTDLIVGFPGETQKEWEETTAFVREMGFSHIHIFTYSPRNGTKAATLQGRIPKDVQRSRSQELHAIAAESKMTSLSSHIGQTRAVLWEGRRNVGDDRTLWSGYTDNYLRVDTVVAASRDLTNTITNARLIDTSEGRLLAALAETG